MSKKTYFGILAIMIITITGCGKQIDSKLSDDNGGGHTTQSTYYQVSDLPDDMDHEPPAGLGIDLSNEEIFETGYYCIQYDSFEEANIFFESNNEKDADIEWSVYIVDEELSIEEIGDLSTQDPVAINEGSARVNGGQWIYVLCNINSKTASEPSNSTFRFYSFRNYA
ncbi:MAG: hypothetical protein ACI4DW_06300 [Lachnospiraceae bacterium]